MHMRLSSPTFRSSSDLHSRASHTPAGASGDRTVTVTGGDPLLAELPAGEPPAGAPRHTNAPACSARLAWFSPAQQHQPRVREQRRPPAAPGWPVSALRSSTSRL